MLKRCCCKLIAVKTHHARGRGAYKLGVGGWERGAETSECERQMRVMVRKGTGKCTCLLDLFVAVVFAVWWDIRGADVG